MDRVESLRSWAFGTTNLIDSSTYLHLACEFCPLIREKLVFPRSNYALPLDYDS